MKWRIGKSLGNQHGVLSTVFFSVVLASTALLFATHAGAIGPFETDPSDAPPITQSDSGGGDELDRVQATQARFGVFGGEDYKNALIADAQLHAAKYAAQLGVNAPREFRNGARSGRQAPNTRRTASRCRFPTAGGPGVSFKIQMIPTRSTC